MTLQELKTLFEQDVQQKNNTYIVPLSKNNLKMIRDELCYVREVKEKSFIIFRALDGKLYEFSEDKLKMFKLVGR